MPVELPQRPEWLPEPVYEQLSAATTDPEPVRAMAGTLCFSPRAELYWRSRAGDYVAQYPRTERLWDLATCVAIARAGEPIPGARGQIGRSMAPLFQTKRERRQARERVIKLALELRDALPSAQAEELSTGMLMTLGRARREGEPRAYDSPTLDRVLGALETFLRSEIEHIDLLPAFNDTADRPLRIFLRVVAGFHQERIGLEGADLMDRTAELAAAAFDRNVTRLDALNALKPAKTRRPRQM